MFKKIRKGCLGTRKVSNETKSHNNVRKQDYLHSMNKKIEQEHRRVKEAERAEKNEREEVAEAERIVKDMFDSFKQITRDD
nr:hypothetical protein Iba_chr13aCG9620 [Ipomoea batatas]